MVALLTALMITASTCADNTATPEAVEVISSGAISTWVQIISPSIDQLDLVFVGEGFQDTEEDQEKFHEWVDRAIDAIAEADPLRSCAFNYHRVLLKSNDAGADRYYEDGVYYPECVPLEEPDCRDTALNFSFGHVEDGVPCWWLYTQTPDLCVEAAEMATDDADFIFVVVNDDLYGGWAYYSLKIAAASCSSSFEEIVLHEMGHVLGDLGDEYADRDDCYPFSEPVEPNITTETDRANIKWNELIDSTTPVPTTEDELEDLGIAPDDIANTVGLWEGADDYLPCVYRPQLKCKMKALGDPFCKVCANELESVLKNRCMEDFIISSGWKAAFRIPCVPRFIIRFRLPQCLICLFDAWAAGTAGPGPDHIRITVGPLPRASVVQIKDLSETVLTSYTVLHPGDTATVEFDAMRFQSFYLDLAVGDCLTGDTLDVKFQLWINGVRIPLP